VNAAHVAACTLCPPRNPAAEDRYEIVSLSISTLYLYGDQRFRGYSVLAFDARHAVALAELSKSEYIRYMEDLRISVTAITLALDPDHMNVEQMGNALPHLHWHIVPRYKDDPRWGNPIWIDWPPSEFNVNRKNLPADEALGMVERIRSHIEPSIR
jgi:diadenosine tetraphosphate (Ap4A) HIT family hydrolase